MSSDKYYAMVLLNGTTILFRNGYAPKQRIYLFVDVNGVDKPNTWGYDLFAFSYSDNLKNFELQGIPNGIHPYNVNCIKNGKLAEGWGYAYYVLKIKHKIDYKYFRQLSNTNQNQPVGVGFCQLLHEQ